MKRFVGFKRLEVAFRLLAAICVSVTTSYAEPPSDLDLLIERYQLAIEAILKSESVAQTRENAELAARIAFQIDSVLSTPDETSQETNTKNWWIRGVAAAAIGTHTMYQIFKIDEEWWNPGANPYRPLIVVAGMAVVVALLTIPKQQALKKREMSCQGVLGDETQAGG